jgi:DNA-binding MarR family transcriptional regulator
MSKQHYKVETYQPRSSVGHLLRRSNTLILDTLEPVFAALGFTFTQYLVLVWLRDGIARNAKDICSELHHDSGALARVIEQLAERGLIERVRGLDDRRKVDLRLTAAGRQAVEHLLPPVIEKLNSALEDFSAAELQEFVRLLTKFSSSIHTKMPRPRDCLKE